jgi:hypothetical protein
MGVEKLPRVHIVAVTHEGKPNIGRRQPRDGRPGDAIRKQIPLDSTMKLVKRFLSPKQLSELNLRPHSVCKLPKTFITPSSKQEAE